MPKMTPKIEKRKNPRFLFNVIEIRRVLRHSGKFNLQFLSNYINYIMKNIKIENLSTNKVTHQIPVCSETTCINDGEENKLT